MLFNRHTEELLTLALRASPPTNAEAQLGPTQSGARKLDLESTPAATEADTSLLAAYATTVSTEKPRSASLTLIVPIAELWRESGGRVRRKGVGVAAGLRLGVNKIIGAELESFGLRFGFGFGFGFGRWGNE